MSRGSLDSILKDKTIDLQWEQRVRFLIDAAQARSYPIDVH